MITIVIPTLNAGKALPETLAALMPATVQGLIKQVIIADGGSTDETQSIASVSGADFITGSKGRGAQLAAGASHARGDWLLFLHADTVLGEGWEREAAAFITSDKKQAGYFHLRFDENNWKARLIEFGVRLRCLLFKLPYGDQGLLVSKSFYEQLGGYGQMPLFEDVDIVARIKRDGKLIALTHEAITSAKRYEQDGYGARVLINMKCLFAYWRGVPPARILERYR